MKKTKSNGKYPKALKRKIAQEYLAGKFSYAVAAEEYGLSHKSVVQEFVKWYRKNYELGEMKKTEDSPRPEAYPDPKQWNERQAARRIEELEKELSQTKLKLASVEALIDVAEQNLGIDIRKKSGSKPSK